MILVFSFIGVAKADAGPSSELTTFYFNKNGQPFTQPVKFTIKCYGTSVMDSTNKLLKISEIAETCQAYGCQFDTTNIFEPYKQNIKYCDLEGEASGNKFVVNDFLAPSMSGLNCHSADYTIALPDSKYYKETQKYKDCQSNVYREYYPSGGGDVKGDFLCAQYETDDKLIPTTISTEPNGPCYRYGYTIENNKCYQIPDEFFACTGAEQQKLNLCNQYLEDVTSKLAKDTNGYPYESICEAKINIPASISNSNNQQTPNTQPTTPAGQPHKSIFSRVIDFFRCSFLKIFGKSC